MNDSAVAKKPPVALAVPLLFVIALLLGACSGPTGQNTGDPGREEREPRDETQGETQNETAPATPGPETTAEDPPNITLGEEPGGQPEVVLRLEGGPNTAFSGLCSVGDRQSVLEGKVPERFTFNPRGRELSCRIQKRDDGRGALKIVLVAGNTTRSIQQTNAPGGTINLSYSG